MHPKGKYNVEPVTWVVCFSLSILDTNLSDVFLTKILKSNIISEVST